MGHAPIEARLAMILKSLKSIELSDEERKYLVWLAGWDVDTANNFISIVEKLKMNKETPGE